MKNGILDPVFAALQNNPSIAAGTCTFAVAFALVAGNAFYAQSGSHPDPIWATRDATITQSVSPDIRPVKTTQFRAKTIPVPTARQENGAVASTAPVASILVADIQQALVRSGDFNGEVDGLSGPLTRSAIADYQKRHGMEPDGKPSEALLAKILRDMPTIVGGSQTGAAAITNDPLSGLISNETASAGTLYDRQLVQTIQVAIAKAGIADIKADGIFGSQTRAAIEEFQRANQLQVTGKPDAAVLQKLVLLGLLS